MVVQVAQVRSACTAWPGRRGVGERFVAHSDPELVQHPAVAGVLAERSASPSSRSSAIWPSRASSLSSACRSGRMSPLTVAWR